MSFYCLVEGKTELNIYPLWLSYLRPTYTRVGKIEDIKKPNDYCLESYGGNPLILDAFERGIEKIKLNGVNINHFILILDSEEDSISSLTMEFNSIVNSFAHKKLSYTFNLIIQPISIEAWFLGNRKIFPRTPDPELKKFINFYNTKINDPELLSSLSPSLKSTYSTRARFYKFYLKKLFHAKTSGRISYAPPKIDYIKANNYFEEINTRANTISDMEYFREMYAFFNKL